MTKSKTFVTAMPENFGKKLQKKPIFFKRKNSEIWNHDSFCYIC